MLGRIVALVGLLAASLALAAPGAAQAPSAPSLSGLASGAFALPGPAGPGRMVGRLVDASGATRFAVNAAVLPDGSVRGTATVVGGPAAGNQLALRGGWAVGAPGRGRVQAVLIAPPDPTSGRPPRRVGGIAVGFGDPDGPLPNPGIFRGRWKVGP